MTGTSAFYLNFIEHPIQDLLLSLEIYRELLTFSNNNTDELKKKMGVCFILINVKKKVWNTEAGGFKQDKLEGNNDLHIYNYWKVSNLSYQFRCSLF